MKLDTKKLLCYCNDKNMEEIADIIKRNNISSLEELIDCAECCVGDKCEACHEDGYENDGYSLAMVLSLVKQKRL